MNHEGQEASACALETDVGVSLDEGAGAREVANSEPPGMEGARGEITRGGGITRGSTGGDGKG